LTTVEMASDRRTASIAGATRPYRAIVSARFRTLLQYRAAALGGLWTQIFFGLVLLGIYEGFYGSTTRPQPMHFNDIVSYIWLGQALLAMLPWNGAGLPLIGLEEWRLAAPPSLESAVAFAAVLVCALLLGCALTTLVNISLLWTVSGEGAVIMLTAIVTFFSGMTIPLPLFPDWAQPFVRALPFAGLVDMPLRVYTGHIPPDAVASVLRHQLLWTAAIVILGRFLLSRGLRRITVQGG
jgi:ABC-2 type transport system permease protein